MQIRFGANKRWPPPRVLIFIGLLIFCNLTLLLGFFSTPIVGDVTVNLASVKQARYLGHWPSSVIESWDLRGLLNKNLMFFLEKLSDFDIFKAISTKELIVKAVYFSLVMLAFIISALVLKEHFSNQIDILFLVLLMGITVFSVSNSFVALQAELSAAIVGILITALTSSENRKKLILSGILCCVTFGFKGVTVLIGISAVFAGFALNRSNFISRLRTVGGSFLISFSLYFFAIFFIIPSELIDLGNATSLQSNFSYSILGRLKISIGSVFFQWPHVPIFAIGIFFYCGLAINYLKSKISNSSSKMRDELLLLTLSLFFAFCSILIQSKGFGYHLASMIPFSFAAILQHFNGSVKLRKMNNQVIYLSFVLLLIVASPTQSGIWGNFLKSYAFQITTDNQSFSLNYESRNQALVSLGKRLDENCSGDILFLDGGSNYVVDNRSWLRFVVPMPIQRNVISKRGLSLQRETVEYAIKFTGECVTIEPSRMNSVLQPWAVPLYNKIGNNYVAIWEETYQLYGENRTTLILRRKI